MYLKDPSCWILHFFKFTALTSIFIQVDQPPIKHFCFFRLQLNVIKFKLFRCLLSIELNVFNERCMSEINVNQLNFTKCNIGFIALLKKITEAMTWVQINTL